LTSAGSAGTVFYSSGTGFANTAVGSSGECLKSNGAGVPYWSECGGSGSGSSLQIAYDEGNTITTDNNRNIEFTLADTATDSDFIVNMLGTGNVFDVQDTGTSKLIVESNTGYVGINDATPSYQLDVAGTGRFTNDLLVDGNTTLGNASTDSTSVNGTLAVSGGISDALIELVADTDNSGEDDNPLFIMRQDGNLVNGLLGINGTTDTLYTGAIANATFIEAKDTGGGAPFQVVTGGTTIGGTDGTARLTVLANGNVGVGASPLAGLSVNPEGQAIGAHFSNYGHSGATYVGIGANTTFTQGNYALLMSTTNTFLNAPSGGAVYLRVANASVLTASAGSVVIVGTLSATDITCSNCINAGDLAADSVGASEIAANAVGTSEVANNTLTASDLAANSVGTSEVSDNSLTATDLAANSVGNSEIANTANFDFGDVDANGGDVYVRSGSAYTRVHSNGTNGYIDSTGILYLRPNNGAGTTWVDMLGFGTADYFYSEALATPQLEGFSANVCRSNVDAYGNYQIGACNPSSQRYKNTITYYGGGIGNNLDKIRQLRPVNYYYNAEYNTPEWQVGLIAEEVAAVDPLLANYKNGQIESVEYQKIPVLLLAALKDLDLIVQDQESRLTQAEQTLAVLNSTTTNLTKSNLTVTNRVTTAKLRVTGLTELTDLKVTGLTELADLKVEGNITSVGDVPDSALGAVLTGVLGASITNDGTNTAGTVTIDSGTEVSIAGEIAEIEFTESYVNPPKIVISGNNSQSAKLGAYVERTEDGFKIVADDSLDIDTDYSFDYIIVETQNP
jgi:hypothetical protein